MIPPAMPCCAEDDKGKPGVDTNPDWFHHHRKSRQQDWMISSWLIVVCSECSTCNAIKHHIHAYNKLSGNV